MDWKEAAREAVEDIEHDGLRGGLQDLHRQYMIDQQELAKLMIVSSLALMTVSIPSAMTLNDAHSQMEQASNSLSRTTSVANSDAFRSNIQSLQQRLQGNMASSLGTVLESLEEAGETSESLDKTEKELETKAETFSWLSLISIVGLVSGIVTLYV